MRSQCRHCGHTDSNVFICGSCNLHKRLDCPPGTIAPDEVTRRPTLATVAELEATIASLKEKPPALISEVVLVAAIFATDPRVEQLVRTHGEVRGPHQDIFPLIAKAWQRARAGQEPEVSLLRDAEVRAPKMRSFVARLAEMRRDLSATMVGSARDYIEGRR